MYSITVKNYDRVVTPGGLNAGTESIRGLSEDNMVSLARGQSVYSLSRFTPRMEVQLNSHLSQWNFIGKPETMPDMEKQMSDESLISALRAWADDCELIDPGFAGRKDPAWMVEPPQTSGHYWIRCVLSDGTFLSPAVVEYDVGQSIAWIVGEEYKMHFPNPKVQFYSEPIARPPC